MKRLIINKVLIKSKKSKTGQFAIYFFSHHDLRPELLLLQMVGEHPEISGEVEFVGKILVKDFFKRYPAEDKKFIQRFLKEKEGISGYLIFEE